jgi:hypothetical protein
MTQSSTTIVTEAVKPAVLINRYPVYDSAGNRLQEVMLRFICGHTERYFSLDIGKGWKPRTNRQIERDELRITCPIGWKLCRACSESGAA